MKRINLKNNSFNEISGGFVDICTAAMVGSAPEYYVAQYCDYNKMKNCVGFKKFTNKAEALQFAYSLRPCSEETESQINYKSTQNSYYIGVFKQYPFFLHDFCE